MSAGVYYVEVNLICVFVMSLLLFGLARVKKTLRENLYMGLLITAMVMCISDSVAGVLRGKMFEGARTLIWGANMVYFLSTFVLSVLWVLYSMLVLNGRIHKSAVIIASTIGTLGTLLFFTAPLNGLCFSVNEQNLYVRGPYIWIHWVILFPSLVVPSIVAPFTKAGIRERRAIATFAILPFVTTVLQVLVYGLTVSQVGVALSMFLVYVLLQSQLVNEAETRAKLLDEMSCTDTLTKLRNRRAYELRLESLKENEWVGVIFADLNGLKKTNDTKGHVAGDRLICGFAEFLRSHFSEEEVFRISGDEFVVISVDKDNFSFKCNNIKAQIIDRAAFGVCEGRGENAMIVVGQAEKKMYEDKYDYYSRTGIDRRRV